MEITPAKIQETIQKAQQGDQVAFTFLLDYYWDEVYYFMLDRVKNAHDTEDIVIETFDKAFDKVALYNSKYAFNTWLITMAKNAHIDMLRKKKSSLFITVSKDDDVQAFSVVDETPTIEDELITQQNLSTLLTHIKKLTPAYQEVIQLRYFKEMSYKEIAATINEPINNVKVKLLRAKKVLAKIITKSI